MTPMYRLRENFKIFEKFTKKPISLNGCKPKSIPYPFQRGNKSETKGVDSDFIKIYPISETESFAIAFNYKNCGEPADTTFVRVLVSYKVNDKFKEAEVPYELFRQEFNKIIEQLLSGEDLYTTIKCFVDQYHVEKNVSFYIKTVMPYIKSDIDKLKRNVVELSSKEKALELNLDVITQELEAMPEFNKVIQMKEELRKAEEILKNKEEELNKKFKVRELKRHVNMLTRTEDKLRVTISRYIRCKVHNKKEASLVFQEVMEK